MGRAELQCQERQAIRDGERGRPLQVGHLAGYRRAGRQAGREPGFSPGTGEVGWLWHGGEKFLPPEILGGGATKTTLHAAGRKLLRALESIPLRNRGPRFYLARLWLIFTTSARRP